MTKVTPVEELQSKEFLTVSETARLLSSSRQLIYDLIKSGRLQAVNLKVKKTMVSRASIEKLFNK